MRISHGVLAPLDKAVIIWISWSGTLSRLSYKAWRHRVSSTTSACSDVPNKREEATTGTVLPSSTNVSFKYLTALVVATSTWAMTLSRPLSSVLKKESKSNPLLPRVEVVLDEGRASEDVFGDGRVVGVGSQLRGRFSDSSSTRKLKWKIFNDRRTASYMWMTTARLYRDLLTKILACSEL